MTQNPNDQNFLTYLQKNHLYLYKTEMAVRKIMDKTGYGDVSISLRIRKNQVDKINILLNMEEILVKRKGNVFE